MPFQKMRLAGWLVGVEVGHRVTEVPLSFFFVNRWWP